MSSAIKHEEEVVKLKLCLCEVCLYFQFEMQMLPSRSGQLWQYIRERPMSSTYSLLLVSTVVVG